MPPESADTAPPLYAPMLATAGPLPGPDSDFAFEVKWDGALTLCYLDGAGGLRVLSRGGIDMTARFPELAPLPVALASRGAVLVGELVAFGPDGRPDFALLQQRLHTRRSAAIAARARTVPVVLMLFDVLWLAGAHDLSALPFRDRRAVLEGLGLALPSVRVPPIWVGERASALEFVRRHELEGLVAKRLTSRYVGGRSRDWIKIKLGRSDDFVIGGWIPQAAATPSVKAVLVGERAGGALRFVGAVGSGFAHAERRALAPALARIETPDSPFTAPGPAGRGAARWVRPQLACEVRYLERGRDGGLRHPVWHGLR